MVEGKCMVSVSNQGEFEFFCIILQSYIGKEIAQVLKEHFCMIAKILMIQIGVRVIRTNNMSKL